MIATFGLFSFWVGFVVGGVVAIVLAWTPWVSVSEDDDWGFGSYLAGWLAVLGPVIAGLIVLVIVLAGG